MKENSAIYWILYVCRTKPLSVYGFILKVSLHFQNQPTFPQKCLMQMVFFVLNFIKSIFPSPKLTRSQLVVLLEINLKLFALIEWFASWLTPPWICFTANISLDRVLATCYPLLGLIKQPTDIWFWKLVEHCVF